MNARIEIARDLANKKVTVVRQFAAPVEKVWRAWTEAELLDKWWAPKPWKAETKIMNFTPGGSWLYGMVSPEGERHYSHVVFKTIDNGKGFTNECTFCDEEGKATPGVPPMYWDVKFTSTETGSIVIAVLNFDEQAGLEMILQMGFEGGFSMALTNLDELLEE